MADHAYIASLQEAAEQFVTRARDEFNERTKNWPVDLTQGEVHEVIGSLLARQLTLATQLAYCPAIWTHDIAPLVLRAMADVYITIAWVLPLPQERSKKFIHYGLGQAKLQLEHRRADLEAREAKPGEQERIADMENWIDGQRATFLTDVNLGSWSGISTRSMAEEAGCLDFYNYVYAPFSACAHSMWHHVAIHNLKTCRNPLHRFHAVPHIGDGMLDWYYLYLAGKYLQKTFATFDEHIGTKIEAPSAFALLCARLEATNEPVEDGPDAP
jgi:Family of unknown function (DUF5677)